MKVKENKNQQNIVFDLGRWGGRETGTDVDTFPLSDAYNGQSLWWILLHP